MLKGLELKFGSSFGQPKLSLPLEPSITIFVGPNNSGKSLLLREIAAYCKSASVGSHTKILEQLECIAVDRATAEIDFANILREPNPSEVIVHGQVPVSIAGKNKQIHADHYYLGREQPKNHLSFFSNYHLGPSTLSLDGQSRLALLDAEDRGDLKYPVTPLSRMFVGNEKRKKWQGMLHDAFGLYPGIDASVGSKLSVRFGQTLPPRERTLEADILDWMREALPVEAVSDGVKAFSGILLQIYAGDPRVIIIDEPEAFLHPSLARALGRELVAAARSEEKFVFASTHSADFLMGAIQSGAIVNIVRLTWDNSGAAARLLPNAELARLMNDPMLRSVGILSTRSHH